jgi:hypothetical protein
MVNEETSRHRLTGWLPMLAGLLALVVGAVWTLQGLNVLTDSRMSDDRVWAIVGPCVAVAGLVLIVIGVQRRSRAKR